jgi:hypothetical protein
MKQTAVEWLAEKYDYAYWMVKRDEISPALAEEWKKHYLEQAKEMEKEQIINSHSKGYQETLNYISTKNALNFPDAEQYYNETFKSE